MPKENDSTINKYIINFTKKIKQIKMSQALVNHEDITFPEELPDSKRIITVPPALKYITSLLYGSGTALSFVYILLILIIQPLLEVQYARRNDLAGFVLKRAREILVTLSKDAKLPPVAIKRGGKFYSDAQIQTDQVNTRTSSVYFEDEKPENENVLNERLKSLKLALLDYNRYYAHVDELNPLTFQIKKFQGRIDAYSQANLLRIRGQSMNDQMSTTKLKQEIRSIKGLFLTGQV